MSKWDDQSAIAEYLSNVIVNEVNSTGESETLDEILSEYCDKDDIRQIYEDEFKRIDNLHDL